MAQRRLGDFVLRRELPRDLRDLAAGARRTVSELLALDRTARGEPAIGSPLKRALDLAIATVALVVLSPLILIIAVVIQLTMGGPIVFTHERIGLGGRSFRCFKFRTMVRGAEHVLERHFAGRPDLRRAWLQFQKLPCDPRVTPVGGFLRKFSLDELPQLVNVILGDMSIVGPRPVTAAEIVRYGVHGRHYLRTRPGLTGLWQVSGRNLLTYRERVVLDTAYVRRWSLALDAAIILRTIPALLSPHETS